MPMYDYDCPACGPFTAMRVMAEFELPQDCPTCGGEAPRVLLTAPAFAGMDRGRRMAAETNERSSHEPKRSSGHGAGCGCCSGKAAKKNAQEPAAAKSFPAARPWMISH
ncbi:zinc ribbon domain-containing protein [Hyphomicrobium sp. CS1GBMeth3]|uniref:FmdB family zinc ribbon protein n=1 Tax=Hyphomicrobium sp. CS1GBMeth3 TaxID=1892845 RepID=UPI000930CB8E|nr:zinc ribbon domain-containing protein [Hyphomicrobium sp. CS1GBMeth3]